MTETTNYYMEAKSDARGTARNFFDEIIQQLLESGEASNDLHNDYTHGDEWHHERHVDKSYNLSEAAELLDQLSEWEEDDEGLWQGLPPRDAIGAQAAYTYGNCVIAKFRDLIEEINDDQDIADLIELIGRTEKEDEKEELTESLRGTVKGIIDGF